MTSAATEPWLSLADAAQACGVSSRTLRRWVKSGRFSRVKRNGRQIFVHASEVPGAPAGAAFAPSGFFVPAITRPLVGRDDDAVEVIAQLAAGCRLITIVGPPGVGKTRLAIHLAAATRARGMHPIYCDLRGASGSDPLSWALSRSLGVHATGDKAQRDERLLRTISAQSRPLVILDEVEGVIEEAARQLTGWLAAAPTAAFLVTSRETLRVSGETVHRLSGLAPDAAAALFRARAEPGAFTGAADERALSEVLALLGGIPLAIELAAAQTATASLPELREGVQNSQLALRAHLRDEELVSLRATLERSWRLCTSEQQKTWATCSLFRGSFDVETAAVVLGREPLDARARVGELRARSLLMDVVGLSRKRFRLYATIEERGREELSSNPTWGAAAMRRYRDHWIVRAESAWALERGGLDGAALSTLLDTLEAERLDLEEALRDALEAGQPRRDDAAAIVLALEVLYGARRPLAVRLALLGSIVRGDGVSTARWAEIRLARAEVLRRLGRLDDAEALYAAIAAEAQRDSDATLLAWTEHGLGGVEFGRSRPDDAERRLRRLLARDAPDADRRLRGRILGSLGVLCMLRGAADEAEVFFIEACRALSGVDPKQELHHACNLAYLAVDTGRPGARRYAERALALADALRDVLSANARGMVAMAAINEGKWDEAERGIVASNEAYRRLGEERLEGLAEGNLGALRLLTGAAEDAVEHQRKSVALLRAEGVGSELALSLARLATAEAVVGRHREARGRLHEAQAALEEAPALDPAARQHLDALDAMLAVLADPRDDCRAAFTEQMRRRSAASARTTLDARMLEPILERVLNRGVGAVLLVGPFGHWFRFGGGERVDLKERGPSRLALLALAEHHRDAPAQPLSTFALLAEAWPGDRVLPDAGATRVRSTVLRLRRAGLRGVLLSQPGGYLLDPSATVLFDASN